jgi:hypothetical protein
MRNSTSLFARLSENAFFPPECGRARPPALVLRIITKPKPESEGDRPGPQRGVRSIISPVFLVSDRPSDAGCSLCDLWLNFILVLPKEQTPSS